MLQVSAVRLREVRHHSSRNEVVTSKLNEELAVETTSLHIYRSRVLWWTIPLYIYIWEMLGWATINKPWTEKWSWDFHNHLKSWRDSPSKLVFFFPSASVTYCGVFVFKTWMTLVELFFFRNVLSFSREASGVGWFLKGKLVAYLLVVESICIDIYIYII